MSRMTRCARVDARATARGRTCACERARALPKTLNTSEREAYKDLDEELYGLVLTCLEIVQSTEKASDKQKADAETSTRK